MYSLHLLGIAFLWKIDFIVKSLTTHIQTQPKKTEKKKQFSKFEANKEIN